MSPIILKQYSWKETERNLCISVEIPGVSARNLNVFASDVYLKLHSPPFFWEICLANKVVDDSVCVRVGNGVVLLTITKAEQGLWKTIADDKQDNKRLVQRRREEIAKQQQRTSEKIKMNMDKINKQLVQTQIEAENQAKEKINIMKRKEKREAFEAMASETIKQLSKQDRAHRAIPPPRNRSTIQVRFTEAPTQAPVREVLQR